MYKFSFIENIAGKAHEVSRQLFDSLIDNPKTKSLCDQIAQAKTNEERGKLKRELPAFCWHANFDQGIRKNENAHPSGLVMIDVDHVDNPREVFARIEGKSKDLHLMAAHITPSTKGLRLVCPTLEGMDIPASQAYYVKKLDLENVDTCTKDLARMSFIVPRDYWLYISEELFAEPKKYLAEGEEKEISAEDRQKSSLKEYPTEYEGTPYTDIVRELVRVMGGEPEHGRRNNFIFQCACYLRTICDDDAAWIAEVLPTFGEAEEKWRRTIESACARVQNRSMSPYLRKAISAAQGKADYESEVPPILPNRLPRLIRHLTKNVPEVCREMVANGVFAALGTYLNNVRFTLLDKSEKEPNFMCVCMAPQSSGKSAINKPIEYITRDIAEQDEANREREQAWKDEVAKKGANKEKPERPKDLCVQILSSDMTNAAFVQRMKDANGKYLYSNLEELELLRQLQTNGTKNVNKIICLSHDNGKYGQERVGTASVTARVRLRWNWNAASTVQKGLKFFSSALADGTLSRLSLSTIIPDETKPFVYGKYDEKYAEELQPYIDNLKKAEGLTECKPALDLAKRLLEKCLSEAALASDDVYRTLAFRAVTIAHSKAILLYLAHDRKWSKEIGEFMVWSLEYDLWCKMHFFGKQMKEEREKEEVSNSVSRTNLLDLLPDQFNLQQAAAMRVKQGKSEKGTYQMLRCWKFRGYITLLAPQQWEKTEKYKGKIA